MSDSETLQFTPPYSIAIIGETKSGKSVIIKNIMENSVDYFEHVFVFIDTNKYNHEY